MSKTDKILNSVNKVAQFMARQTYFRAMRDAFAMAIPFLVLTGFSTLFTAVILDPAGFLGGIVPAEILTSLQMLGTKINNGTMNVLSLLIVVLVSYSLAVTRKAPNPIIAVVVAFSCMIILMPTTLDIVPTGAEDAVTVSGVVPYSLTNAGGMFVAIFTGLFATELFVKLSNIDRLKIELGPGVPGAVTASFNSLISVMLTLLTFGLVSYLLVTITGFEVSEIITMLIQAPLVGLTTSLPGFLVLCGMTNLLFFFGIHAGGIINPILEPPLLVAMQQNTEAFAAGLDIPNIIVLPFRDLYGHIGGTGSTIALLLLIFLVSRVSAHKTFAKMVVPVGIFNINEPVVFGFPILFNPFMIIPFVFGPLVLFCIAYFATWAGLVSRIVAYVPWSVPPFINAWMGSGGDIRNVILQVILVIVQMAIYFPFLKLYERSLGQNAAEEQAELASEQVK